MCIDSGTEMGGTWITSPESSCQLFTVAPLNGIYSESTTPYLCPETGGITLKSTTISVPHQVVHSPSAVI